MNYLITAALLIPFASAAQQPKTDTARPKTVVLDSVTVNTGYQVLTRERATGAYSQVDNRTLNLQPGPTILQRLESVTSAVAFNKKNNTAPAISVRGLSTINGPVAPLIILDNFPYNGNIEDINPNLVESVTILKDATAASVWGTRAGNGVIVINTKKGKYNQPLTVDYSSTLQVFSKTDLSYRKAVSAGDYIDLEQFLFDKGYYNALLSNPSHPAVSPVVELLDQKSRGLITAAAADGVIATLRQQDLEEEYRKYRYSNHTVNQQHALQLSGGSSQLAWSAALGYDCNFSELAERYQRYTARLENSIRPAKNLRVTASILYTGTTGSSGKGAYGSDRYLYPYTRFYDDNGNPLPQPRDLRMSWTDTLGAGRLLDWNYYPATNYRYTPQTTGTGSLLGNLALQYQLAPGLSLEARFQYESRQEERSSLMEAASYDTRYYINIYSQLNYTTGMVTRPLPMGGILDRSSNGIRAGSWREQLNYTRSFGRHQLVALLGQETREIRTEGEAWRVFGYDPETLTGTLTDQKNNYPVITTGELYPLPGMNEFAATLNRFVSFFGNAAWTMDRKYQLSLSGRRDASNLFGVNTNNKWTPLWSAGAGWELSGESFYKWAALPFLKLRATWGYTGNADPGRSAIITVQSLGNSLSSGLPSARVRQFPNPDLRWEKVGQGNLGLDFSSRGGRVSGSVDYYVKHAKDLLATAPVDITAGLNRNGVTKNIAAMKGRGIDLVLNTKLATGRLKWSASLLLNWNTDKVTKVFFTNPAASSWISDGASITAWEGRPVHSIISYAWAGLDPANGNPRGYLSGLVSTDYTALTGSGTTLDQLVYSGPSLPQWFGSLSNSVEWKQFRLDVNISYKFRYFFKRQPLHYGDLFAVDHYSTADLSRRWRQPGDEAVTDIPSLQYPLAANRDYFYSGAATLVEKGDHIRLQFINLSWNSTVGKPGRYLKKQVQLFVNAANLGILWRDNKRGLDPDYSVTGLLPPPSFALGLKLNFQ